MPSTLFRRSWDAAALVAAHPPRFTHPNKLAVYDVACPPGTVHRGTITVARYAPAPLPEVVGGPVAVEERGGYYDYGPVPAGVIAWHQNFADPVVFGFYAGALFAQDEMQVTEHPALASVRGALVAEGHGWSADARGPTPVLVTGVERRCFVDTAPSLERGRIQGLYGNRFGAANPDIVRGATTRIDPPTVSNILAIAAPHPSSGRYTVEQIAAVLRSAHTGYAAVKIESALVAPGAKVALHTGMWGCGAFGGDRVLMVALQLLAARLVGLDVVVLHLGDATGRHAVAEARGLVAGIGEGTSVAGAIEALAARGFRWGQSDGN